MLDNITGDGQIYPKCSEDSLCKEYEKFSESEEQYKELYLERKEIIDNSRDKKIRNDGSISKRQLNWLKNDLENTSKNKVVIFSELPIYYYIRNDGKIFDIKNRKFLEEIIFNSGKKIVSISADAHNWYEFKQENVIYYGIDSFTHSHGNWALFKWGENDPELTKMNSGLRRE